MQCCLFYKILVTDAGTSGRRQYHCSACKSFPAEAVGTLSALLVHLQAENFLQHFALVVAIGAYIALFHFFHNHIEASSRCSLVLPNHATGFIQFAHDFRILVIELFRDVQPIFRQVCSHSRQDVWSISNQRSSRIPIIGDTHYNFLPGKDRQPRKETH